MTYAPRVPSVIYEVVPDRFKVGGGLSSGDKLKGPLYGRPGMKTSSEDSDDPRIHHGGDLQGVTESLPHLHSLGVTGLYLTSIFRASRADKNGVENFLEVDPAFGDLAQFTRLVEAARALGIGVILDGIFGYVGRDHPWFTSGQPQEDDDTRLDPSERTRSFFFFNAKGAEDYALFHGEDDHPELNLHNPELRRRLFTGDRSVVHEWLQRGAVGWRLHRADEMGYAALREITLAARTGGEQKFIIGDVRGFADRFVKDGLLDGVVNRYLREGIIAFLQGQIPASQLSAILRDQVQRYGRDALNRSWTFLSSHDTKRLAGALKGDMERVRLAVTLMYALPGAATIYYGEELGLGGRNPHHTQLVMDWDEQSWDNSLLQHHQHLGKLKNSLPSLTKGDFIDLTPQGDQDVIAFARTRRDPRETVIAIFNRAYRPQQRMLFIPVSEIPDGLPMRDLMGGEGATVRAGTLSMEVPPTGGKILVPDAGSRSHHFFRNL